MATLNDMIWGADSSRRIMTEARKKFAQASVADLPSAYVAYASVHWSQASQYTTSARKVLGLWHAWRGVWNVNVALQIVNWDIEHFNPDQIETATRILAKSPRWLGGNRVFAHSVLTTVLMKRPFLKTKPHTRALMMITLAEIDASWGKIESGIRHMQDARFLIKEIEVEDCDDREQQLVRVLSAVGFFLFDHERNEEYYWMIVRARELARRVAPSQLPKIEHERKVRGMM